MAHLPVHRGCRDTRTCWPRPRQAQTRPKTPRRLRHQRHREFLGHRRGRSQAGGEKYGAIANAYMPAEGIADQKRIIEDLLTRGVDGLAISPIDPANQADLINQACEVTRVITHDSDAPGTKRLCYIGMDNYTAGRMCGKLVKEAMPEGGSVMIFIGRLEQDNARRRRQGVIDELLDREPDPSRYDAPGERLKGAKYSIVGTLTDQFDMAKGKA